LWLEREFEWTEQTALNYMRINALAHSPSKTVLNLDVPMRALYLLAAPSTPDEARESVTERAASGERITYAKVREAVRDAQIEDDEPAPEPVTGKSYPTAKPRSRTVAPAGAPTEAIIRQILDLFQMLGPADRDRVQDGQDRIRQGETGEEGS
jgi:hypothetical protein